MPDDHRLPEAADLKRWAHYLWRHGLIDGLTYGKVRQAIAAYEREG